MSEEQKPQKQEFAFNAKEIVEVEKMLIRYGDPLTVIIEWAIQRGCRRNPAKLQCIAQIVTRMQQLGGAKAFVEDMKTRSEKKIPTESNTEPTIEAAEGRIKQMIDEAMKTKQALASQGDLA